MFCLTVFKFLKGEVFDAFIKVIPNFYSCKANVEFTIVCFDGIDVIGWLKKNKKTIKLPGIDLKVSQCSLPEYAKSLESRAKDTYSLWLNDRQPVKILKSLNDRQSDIFLKF